VSKRTRQGVATVKRQHHGKPVPVGRQQQQPKPRHDRRKGHGHVPNQAGTRDVPTRTRDEEAPVSGVAEVETVEAQDATAEAGVSTQPAEVVREEESAAVLALPAPVAPAAPVSSELVLVEHAPVPVVVAEEAPAAVAAFEPAPVAVAQPSLAPSTPAPGPAPVPVPESAAGTDLAALLAAEAQQQAEHEPRYLDKGMYVMLGMSMAVGWGGQGMFLSEQLTPSLGRTAGTIAGWLAGGFLEVAMISTCDGAFKYRGMGVRMWGWLLFVAFLAGGFATFTNVVHWLPKGMGSAVTFGAASMFGFLVHVIHRWLQSSIQKEQREAREQLMKDLFAQEEDRRDREEKRLERLERRASKATGQAAEVKVTAAKKPAAEQETGSNVDGVAFVREHEHLTTPKELAAKWAELHPKVQVPTDRSFRRWRARAGQNELATASA
jgi:hypothetical protein